MPYHRYKIGQMVALRSPFGSTDPCTIIRLLPLVEDEPIYRVRGVLDGQERTLPERQIAATPTDARLGSRHFPERQWKVA